MTDELPEHVQRNRAYWDAMAHEWVSAGVRSWTAPEPYWGLWHVPESELHLLPDDLDGKDAIELGCGTGYVSSWLMRRGARVIGIDNSAEQLKTAARLQAEHNLSFPLTHGSAEAVPRPDASFDFAISEYGAAIWCDPYAWIPEAARLLRPGGRLVFLGNSSLLAICTPDDDEPVSNVLLRPYFGMHRFEFTDSGYPGTPSVEFHLPHGEMLRLLRKSRFEIIDLIEIQAPPADDLPRFGVTNEWARQWPCEDVWIVDKV